MLLMEHRASALRQYGDDDSDSLTADRDPSPSAPPDALGHFRAAHHHDGGQLPILSIITALIHMPHKPQHHALPSVHHACSRPHVAAYFFLPDEFFDFAVTSTPCDAKNSLSSSNDLVDKSSSSVVPSLKNILTEGLRARSLFLKILAEHVRDQTAQCFRAVHCFAHREFLRTASHCRRTIS